MRRDQPGEIPGYNLRRGYERAEPGFALSQILRATTQTWCSCAHTTTGNQHFTFTNRWGNHLGATATAEHPGGAPPDPPPGIGPDTPRSVTGSEPLTPYALDTYLHNLLAA